MNRSDSVDAAGPRALTVSHPGIRPSPQREDLVLPGQDSGKLAFTLHNFLTPEECAMLIAEGEVSTLNKRSSLSRQISEPSQTITPLPYLCARSSNRPLIVLCFNLPCGCGACMCRNVMPDPSSSRLAKCVCRNKIPENTIKTSVFPRVCCCLLHLIALTRLIYTLALYLSRNRVLKRLWSILGMEDKGLCPTCGKGNGTLQTTRSAPRNSTPGYFPFSQAPLRIIAR